MRLTADPIQIAWLALRMETWEEAKVIARYHGVGTVMEVSETGIGSCVARVWRQLDFRSARHPPLRAMPAAAIDLNFFSHHVIWDKGRALVAAGAVLFGRTWVRFQVWRVHRRVPPLAGFRRVSLSIWLAENIGTVSRIWLHPGQKAGLSMVSDQTFGSRFLLMIVSDGLVTLVSRPRMVRRSAREANGADFSAEETVQLR